MKSLNNLTNLNSYFSQADYIFNDFQSWENKNLGYGLGCAYIYADSLVIPFSREKGQLISAVLGVTSEGVEQLLDFSLDVKNHLSNWERIFSKLKDANLPSPQLLIAKRDDSIAEAITNIYPTCKLQYCWDHEIEEILEQFPRRARKQVLYDLNMISTSDFTQEAFDRIDFFGERYSRSYPNPLTKIYLNKERFFTFHDFPAEHWQFIRSTAQLESFLKILSNICTKELQFSSSLTLDREKIYYLFKLVVSKAQKINSPDLLRKVLNGAKFKDGNFVPRKYRK
ncbi:MAG: transposase [Deltaproteobacteria bacterium]|jgi:transposase-like protein|nr:transposase [Deltaproteobacteria bacterium]